MLRFHNDFFKNVKNEKKRIFFSSSRMHNFRIKPKFQINMIPFVIPVVFVIYIPNFTQICKHLIFKIMKVGIVLRNSILDIKKRAKRGNFVSFSSFVDFLFKLFVLCITSTHFVICIILCP